jgi:ParB family chromosome partitioning protein
MPPSTVEASAAVEMLPMSEIWADADFNSRGAVAPLDVIELAKDVARYGLQQPIVVRPTRDDDDGADGRNWKIISGHRRFKAFEVNSEKTIPCFVKHNISDTDALVMNLSENLHRKDLNIAQEAKAVERLKLKGFSVYDVSDLIGKSSTWVYVRFEFLELPHEIQEAAAAGYIPVTQIRHIYKLKGKDKQLEAARKIKIAKMRGEKIPKINKPKKDMFKKTKREESEVVAMIEHINTHLGMNFGTRCLAWAAGNLSDLELYRDIKDIAERSDIPYVIPEEFQPNLS